MTHIIYEVTYSPACLNELEEYTGTLETADLVLARLLPNLENNPHAFKGDLRYPFWKVAITRPFKMSGRVIPSLRLYFYINELEEQVVIFKVVINPDSRFMM